MTQQPIYIIHADGISAAGQTVPHAMDTFYAGDQPFTVPPHFNYKGLKLGIIPGLSPADGQSRAIALLDMLCERLPAIPAGTKLFFATTVGAIDVLEKAPENDVPDCLDILFQHARKKTGIEQAILVAAACASGQTAAAMAMRAIRLGHCRHALVIGIDITSEFVTGGFASLRAYAKDVSHPYDSQRDGLILGEGAGALLLSGAVQPSGTPDNNANDSAARPIGALIAAYESCDAAHITAPDLTGNALASLIRRTLKDANIDAKDITAIIGHGTGTVFNDESELAALNQLFTQPTPLLSIKGTTGHTLGATGVLQIVYALEFSKRRLLPPQAGLRTPAENARNFVSDTAQPLRHGPVLSLNVGFGGLNSTVLLEAFQ